MKCAFLLSVFMFALSQCVPLTTFVADSWEEYDPRDNLRSQAPPPCGVPPYSRPIFTAARFYHSDRSIRVSFRGESLYISWFRCKFLVS